LDQDGGVRIRQKRKKKERKKERKGWQFSFFKK
jgi:hypothetical protein